MAFLDNSGDIILDAVLTEAGRQRMARGNFRISQYAFGDTEIDYGLYNKNHTSGSAYFDLEILQSPVFEATSNSALPHELYTLNTNDILYAPSLQLNTKLLDAWQEHSGKFYLATNTETFNRLVTVLGDEKYVSQSGQWQKKLIIESGIHTADITNDATTQASYLTNLNLLDTAMNVEADGRFITSVLTQPQNGRARNKTNGAIDANFGSAKTISPSSLSANFKNFQSYTARGIKSEIFNNASVDFTNYVNTKGPQGTMLALNFAVKSGMSAQQTAATPVEYTKFGDTAFKEFASVADTFDIINTTIQVKGMATGAMKNITIALIRGVSLS